MYKLAGLPPHPLLVLGNFGFFGPFAVALQAGHVSSVVQEIASAIIDWDVIKRFL